MLDEMQVNDEQLDASDIRRLESADEVAHFFARLRYDVDARTNIPDYAVLGMGSADMRQHIHKIELIGKDPEDGDISIYLFEVRSVTAKLRNDIARRFRERPENALLVLTKDYEALEFVMLERVLSRSQSRRAALKQAIRPIPLMVNRLHPNPVALRVLKRFFHWELEFPEVFFAPSRPGGQDVQLREDGGFDVVMGNPPYSDIKGLEEIFIRYLFDGYEFMELRINIFAAFIERSLRSCLSPRGLLGFIIPTAFLTQVSYAALRKKILQHHWLREIIRLPNEIFGDASGEVKVDTCLVVVDKAQDRSNLYTSVLIYEGFIRREIIAPETATQAFVIEQNYWIRHDEAAFTLANPTESALLRKMELVSSPLEEYCEFCLGITPYDRYRGHTPEQIKNKVFHANTKLDDTYKKLLVSGDVGRFTVTWNGQEWIKYGEWLAAPREQKFFIEERILIQQIIDWSSLRILSGWTNEELYNTQNQFNLLAKNGISLKYILAILNSTTITYYHRRTFLDASLQRFQKILIKDAKRFPIRCISFTSTTEERQRLTRETIGAYDISNNPGVLQLVQTHIDADKTDVVHDLLAHLSQQMIDLNKQKQAEVKRFLTWVEERLKIHPDKNGADRIDSVTGKTILQGYLGDYQKGEGELPWREFHYRLHQNRNRFAVSLGDVEGEIQHEYEKSLETLIPIKQDLARTDALIDKIVYRLYGLTDEEIELIERPQYEQALADAKAQIVADDKIKDDEEKIEKIAAGILPAAKRFFERVEPKSIEVMLDSELPNWRSLPPDAPTFLLTDDYNLHTLPEHMDFSSSVIPYTKAVETVLYERIFAPFRDGSGYAETDCNNEFLKDFMRGKKKLTLGNFMIILRSSRETALQTFISRIYSDAAQRVFGAKGLVATLNDEVMLDIRNKAAHDEVLSRDEAQQTRAWAMQILEQV